MTRQKTWSTVRTERAPECAWPDRPRGAAELGDCGGAFLTSSRGARGKRVMATPGRCAAAADCSAPAPKHACQALVSHNGLVTHGNPLGQP